jgi:ADP-ribosylglycohydrolase
MSGQNSLRGLAIGDAFGQQWFGGSATVERELAGRELRPGPWPWTDDTAMAVSVVRVLREHGQVDQDALAELFADAYRNDPNRSYGGSMHEVLREIGAGADWRTVTAGMFAGLGSWGNGAAMRVAPLGVWFADDLDAVVDQARAQAVVTHAHPEAAAGAIAVAVAAALAARGVPAAELIPAVLERTPDGEVATGLRRAARLSFALDPRHAAGTLGCGLRISAPDTVPYAVWSAARNLDDLVEALWDTVSPGGDMDTTAAIVGGIVAGRTGLAAIPLDWPVEPLQD